MGWGLQHTNKSLTRQYVQNTVNLISGEQRLTCLCVPPSTNRIPPVASFSGPFGGKIASRYFGGAAKFQSSDRWTRATVHVLPFYKARFFSVRGNARLRENPKFWADPCCCCCFIFFFLEQRKGRTAGTETNRIHGESRSGGIFLRCGFCGEA